jgi:hypothetical protein
MGYGLGYIASTVITMINLRRMWKRTVVSISTHTPTFLKVPWQATEILPTFFAAKESNPGLFEYVVFTLPWRAKVVNNYY